jgi:hypothetical protein
MKRFFGVWCFAFGVWCSYAHAAPTTLPTVGMEGRLVVTLPGTIFEAKPADERSRIVLRIASARPTGAGFEYDLRYMGFVPGKYDLKQLLVRIDGSDASAITPLPVEVTHLLPPNHLGDIIPQPVKPIPFLGGYKTLLAVVLGVWLVALVPILLIGRRRKLAAAAPPPRPVTLADRLRPLVEQAAVGKLSADGQSELERLLLWHWRTRLNLTDSDTADALVQLRRHPEAGQLLRSLESWLHRPPGSAQVDVAAVLAPYRDIPSTPQLQEATR